MKIYFWILFSPSIINIFCTIPIWNIEKSGDDLLNSSSFYQYQTINKVVDGIELKMTRTLQKENDTIYYNNSIHMSYNYVNKINKSVSFDYVESHYVINGQFIVCPKGAHHPFNLNKDEEEIPKDFEETGLKNWDLKCIKPNLGGNYLFILYLLNGKNYFYYKILNSGETGNIKTNDDELYGMRVNNTQYHDGQEGQYNVIALASSEKYLAIKGKIFRFGDKGQQDAGDTFKLCPIKNYTRGYFSDDTNSFYYITYNDIYNFLSGYKLTNRADVYIEKIDWPNGFINNTKPPFEFVDEVEIEDMNFMLYNRFIQYKIKNKNNNKIYNGVLDVVENKVVFNTDEEVNYFLPYSKESILVINSKSAYKICIYRNESGDCVEKCDNGYKLDIDGNKCGSSSSCKDEGKITLIPNNICIKFCDTNIYIKNDTHCGLCKDLNKEDKLFKLINGTNCINFNQTSMEYYNEPLKLLKCKKNYKQDGDQCIYIKPKCYEFCEDCTEYSEDKNNQHCLSCKDKLNLEEGNCKENCSEGSMALNKTCIKCNINYCSSFLINTCNCTSCIEGYFMNNEKNICEECSNECKTCEKENNYCTSCIEGKYLNKEENKCENCSEICGTCSSGIKGNNNNCDSCNISSPYKYLINDTNNNTCVENCTKEGRKFSEDGLKCESLNKTSGDESTNGNKDYLLWIFVIIIAIILIVIIIIIIKKICSDKNSGEIEDISDLNDKTPIIEESQEN